MGYLVNAVVALLMIVLGAIVVYAYSRIGALGVYRTMREQKRKEEKQNGV